MSLNKISMLTAIFLALALFVVIRYMYIPERDKNVLYGQKIESMQKEIGVLNNALLETSKSKAELKEVERTDEKAASWSSDNVPDSVINVVQNAYRRANKN